MKRDKKRQSNTGDEHEKSGRLKMQTHEKVSMKKRKVLQSILSQPFMMPRMLRAGVL